MGHQYFLKESHDSFDKRKIMKYSRTSIIRTSDITNPHFLHSTLNNKKSAITSRNKLLSFLLNIVFCTVLHCNGNIILEKPLDFMHCVASRFGYPNYRWSQLVRIIDILLYLHVVYLLLTFPSDSFNEIIAALNISSVNLFVFPHI